MRELLVRMWRMGHNGSRARATRPSDGSEAGGEADPRRRRRSAVTARGVLFVHSCPPALRPHVEWAVADVFGVPVQLDWQPQPVAPGCLRAQTGWRGSPGAAGRIAAALRGWPLVRAEVAGE